MPTKQPSAANLCLTFWPSRCLQLDNETSKSREILLRLVSHGRLKPFSFLWNMFIWSHKTNYTHYMVQDLARRITACNCTNFLVIFLNKKLYIDIYSQHKVEGWTTDITDVWSFFQHVFEVFISSGLKTSTLSNISIGLKRSSFLSRDENGKNMFDHRGLLPRLMV